MPWARLELALSYSPNWILSPTRLPIPPPGHAIIKFLLKFNEFCQALFQFGLNSFDLADLLPLYLMLKAFRCQYRLLFFYRIKKFQFL